MSAFLVSALSFDLLSLFFSFLSFTSSVFLCFSVFSVFLCEMTQNGP